MSGVLALPRIGPRATVIGLAAALFLSSCGDSDNRQVKALKEQVQRAYGTKEFSKALTLSQKGFALARENMGEKAPDTLYFAQAISEAHLNMRNARGAIPALKTELAMRAAAGQSEQKLQARRTMLIKLAEDAGDKLTAGDQAVAVSKGIDMAPGKDPQPVYKTDTIYPPDQYRGNVEGDVEISYALDSAGAVTSAQVSKSTPSMVFDQAALDSFKGWRFTPMLDRTGRPVSASGFKYTVMFRLRR